jgi:hypothetical protein
VADQPVERSKGKSEVKKVRFQDQTEAKEGDRADNGELSDMDTDEVDKLVR